MEIDDELLGQVVGKLMAIHEDTQTIRHLLEEDDDEPEDDSDFDP